MQHGGWQPAPHAMVPQPMAGPTVARVPLLPGERVLYFKKPDQGIARVGYILAGILTLPILLGFYLVYLGINYEEKVSHYYVITNFRIFTVNARGRILELVNVPEITNLNHRTGNGTNTLSVHSNAQFIQFRHEERHDMAVVKNLLANVRNPAFAQQAPAVAFEP